MLVDAGVIPRKDEKKHPAMETRRPVNPEPEGEQDRITRIAKEMLRRIVEQDRFFTTPLLDADAAEEALHYQR
jgi:hypothetical protein